MAVMTAKDFYGEVNGETINGFYKHLDRNIKTSEDRIKQFDKVYYEDEDKTKVKEIWLDVFDKDRIKVNLTSADSVMSETNVCKFLEAYGTYILNAEDVRDIRDKDGEKIVVCDNIRMARGESRNQSLDMLMENEDSDFSHVLMVERKTDNYKLQIKQEIKQSDFEDEEIGEILTYYKALVNSIDNELSELKPIAKSETATSKEKSEASSRIKRLESIKSEITSFDMIQAKDQLKRTIYFKAIHGSMPVDNEINIENFDYWDKELIRLLAKCEESKCKTEFGKLYAEKFELAYDKVMPTLSDDDIELFEAWKLDKNIKDFAGSKGILSTTANKRITSILTTIQRQMIEDYELDHYYTYLVKGNWKTCSKCGEVKIANEYYFNKQKNTKDGFQPHCKRCNAERPR